MCVSKYYKGILQYRKALDTPKTTPPRVLTDTLKTAACFRCSFEMHQLDKTAWLTTRLALASKAASSEQDSSLKSAPQNWVGSHRIHYMLPIFHTITHTQCTGASESHLPSYDTLMLISLEPFMRLYDLSLEAHGANIRHPSQSLPPSAGGYPPLPALGSHGPATLFKCQSVRCLLKNVLF